MINRTTWVVAIAALIVAAIIVLHAYQPISAGLQEGNAGCENQQAGGLAGGPVGEEHQAASEVDEDDPQQHLEDGKARRALRVACSANVLGKAQLAAGTAGLVLAFVATVAGLVALWVAGVALDKVRLPDETDRPGWPLIGVADAGGRPVWRIANIGGSRIRISGIRIDTIAGGGDTRILAQQAEFTAMRPTLLAAGEAHDLERTGDAAAVRLLVVIRCTGSDLVERRHWATFLLSGAPACHERQEEGAMAQQTS